MRKLFYIFVILLFASCQKESFVPSQEQQEGVGISLTVSVKSDLTKSTTNKTDFEKQISRLTYLVYRQSGVLYKVETRYSLESITFNDLYAETMTFVAIAGVAPTNAITIGSSTLAQLKAQNFPYFGYNAYSPSYPGFSMYGELEVSVSEGAGGTYVIPIHNTNCRLDINSIKTSSTFSSLYSSTQLLEAYVLQAYSGVHIDGTGATTSEITNRKVWYETTWNNGLVLSSSQAVNDAVYRDYSDKDVYIYSSGMSYEDDGFTLPDNSIVFRGIERDDEGDSPGGIGYVRVRALKNCVMHMYTDAEDNYDMAFYATSYSSLMEDYENSVADFATYFCNSDEYDDAYDRNILLSQNQEFYIGYRKDESAYSGKDAAFFTFNSSGCFEILSENYNGNVERVKQSEPSSFDFTLYTEPVASESDYTYVPYLVIKVKTYSNSISTPFTWYYRIALKSNSLKAQCDNRYTFDLTLNGPGSDNPLVDPPGSASIIYSVSAINWTDDSTYQNPSF